MIAIPHKTMDDMRYLYSKLCNTSFLAYEKCKNTQYESVLHHHLYLHQSYESGQHNLYNTLDKKAMREKNVGAVFMLSVDV